MNASNPILEFPHHTHSAHCETGVIVTLLKHMGINMSEPMAFGLSSALNFAYLPFIKVGGQPLIAYRMPPGFVINTLCKRLGIKLKKQKFSSQTEGLRALEDSLKHGHIVGLQTSVFWLPYFPDEMRFHFNAHNLVVYGKRGEEFLVSDPVVEYPVSCPIVDLQKARFAKGALAAKGYMYYPMSTPEKIDYPLLIKKAIASTVKIIDGLPIPIVGNRGIRFLANKIEKLPFTQGKDHNSKLFLGHIVRMQEEIGTGGAGFRFMYASFLQEAANLVHSDLLVEMSEAMTDVGDQWREFAMNAVKLCKGRGDISLRLLADSLRTIADQEQQIIHQLKQYSKQA